MPKNKKAPIVKAKVEVVKKAATKADAAKNQEALREKYGKLKRDWFSLGRDVKVAVERGEPEALGFRNIKDWWDATFTESDSTLWNAFRCAKVLAYLPEATAKKISIVNARQLTRLPEKIRKDEKWTKRAVSMPTKEFRDAVDEARNGAGLKKSKFKSFSRSLPADLYDLVVEAEFKMAKVLKVDISDKSESLVAARITVWEGISSLILTTDESQLKVETTGDTDGQVTEESVIAALTQDRV